MARTLATLKALAQRAGRFLGLAEGDEKPSTAAVIDDYFAEMAWDEVNQVPALAHMAERLSERHEHAADLIRDLFMAAYLATPQLREPGQIEPARLPHRQIIAGMLTSPEFSALRRETVGEPQTAAIAVLSLERRLRDLLNQARVAAAQARAHAEAQARAGQAADAVAAALQRAVAQVRPDGAVPATAARPVLAAIEKAEAAEAQTALAAALANATLSQAAPELRRLGRAAVAEAVEHVLGQQALMTAWGVEPGTAQRMSMAERRELTGRLGSSRMAKFAALIGRFRTLAEGERTRRIERGAGELVGITLSGDVKRAIPSELALLGHRAGRAVFAARLGSRRLLSYDQRAERPAGLGAIIAAVDCSGSMGIPLTAGISREAWAKACALALHDQARAAAPRRDFVGILFSDAGTVKVMRIPAGDLVDMDLLLEFVETFYGGGTDFETPLSAAVAILEEEFIRDGRTHGDIVFITDGECAVRPVWLREHRAAKKRLGFRVFGVAVASRVGTTLQQLSDNTRTIKDLTRPDEAADLYRTI